MDKKECGYLQGYVWRKTYLTELTHRNLIALISVNSIAIIPTILLNALVVFVVAKQRRLRTNSNILLACLAGTDLVAGLVVQPMAVAVEVKRAFGIEPFCKLEKVNGVSFHGLIFASFSHLLLITVDRYIAVKHALRYREIVTKQRIKMAVLVAWLITAVCTIPELFLATIDSKTEFYSVSWTLTGVLYALSALAYIAGISYCYVYIFSETQRQKKRLQTEQLTQQEGKRVKKDHKAAHTLAIILCALILTYLPSVAILVFAVTASHDTLNSGVTLIFSSWASTSVLLGSLVNPVIYCWRNKKLRQAFLEFFQARLPENRAPHKEVMEIQRHRTEIQPSAPREAFSMIALNQKPVLLSASLPKADKIVHIEEMDN